MITWRSMMALGSRLRTAAPVACAVLLAAGCSDGEKVAELEERLAELEASAAKSAEDAELTLENLQAERDQLMQRLEQIELQSGNTTEQFNSLAGDYKTRLGEIENAFNELARRRETLESIAYLPVGFENHSTLGTAHGTFLVRVDSVMPAPDNPQADYVANLNIGNPLGLSVKEFSLRGHFGPVRPEVHIGETADAFRVRYEAWEKSLVPFQHLFLDELRPGDWTKVRLPLRAERLDDIRMLQFVMIVERAFLDNLSGTGELTVISGVAPGTSLAKTAYGAFLINSGRSVQEGTGYRVQLAIGNPFIINIKKVRLLGEFGPLPPKRQDGESLPTFASRLTDWQAELTPFETTIDTPILPGRWNDATILLPAKTVTDLGYIRFTFTPEEAFLPIPEGSSGPQ